jgi:hypothetical protein
VFGGQAIGADPVRIGVGAGAIGGVAQGGDEAAQDGVAQDGGGAAQAGDGGAQVGDGGAGSPSELLKVAHQRRDEMRAGVRQRQSARRESVAVEKKSGQREGVGQITRRK